MPCGNPHLPNQTNHMLTRVIILHSPKLTNQVLPRHHLPPSHTWNPNPNFLLFHHPCPQQVFRPPRATIILLHLPTSSALHPFRRQPPPAQHHHYTATAPPTFRPPQLSSIFSALAQLANAPVTTQERHCYHSHHSASFHRACILHTILHHTVSENKPPPKSTPQTRGEGMWTITTASSETATTPSTPPSSSCETS